MSILSDQQVIAIACPHCGHEHGKTIAWLKANDAIPCGCGQTIVLDHEDFALALAEIEQQLSRTGASGTKH